jgi:serine-aspartate repeat-containing protein C/D/E
VGLLRTVSSLSRVSKLPRSLYDRMRPRSLESPTACLRIFRVEELEPRNLMSASPIQFGAVYYDPHAGDGSQPNLFYISYQGGAAGTQLSQVTISTAKNGSANTVDPPVANDDDFFHTAPSTYMPSGGSPFTVVSSGGATLSGYSVVNDSTLLTLNFSNFTAGETFVFSIKVDEAANPNNVVVEGAEFQGSQITANFTNPNYYSGGGTGTYFDVYDFSQTSLTLPPDSYTPPSPTDQHVYTAGASFPFTQAPLPSSIAGTVFVDPDSDGVYQSGDTLLSGVKLDLYDQNNTLIATTTTNSSGAYSFTGLGPGTYRVHEEQPANYYNGNDVLGSLGGAQSGPDDLTGITLVANNQGVQYNFWELPPPTVSGLVYVDPTGSGVYQAGDPLLSGVTVNLLDPHDHIVATTTTDQNGAYSFTGLTPGTYSIQKLPPVAPPTYFDGGDQVGSVGGTLRGADKITSITLAPGVNGVNYDFGELLPDSLAGVVKIDVDGNCETNPNEPTLAGVTIQLLGAQGSVIATTTTNAQGQYQFTALPPNTVYTLQMNLPTGYFADDDHVGTSGGTLASQTRISQIPLTGYANATGYDFCVVPGGSISGVVKNDVDGNCETNPNEPTLAGVTVQLLDIQGNVIATTTTNAAGEYSFNNLQPGSYGVQEMILPGFFADDSHLGSAGGVLVSNTAIGAVAVGINPDGTAQNDTQYDFCQVAPGGISGYVFQDGPVIALSNTSLTPAQIVATYSDSRPGIFNASDVRIVGATIILADASGNILTDASGNPIETVTDSNGYYSFSGLPPGIYSVIEVRPANYLDGLATAGSTGGTALNPADQIVGITVNSGQTSVNNNFSVLAVSQTALPQTIVWLIPPLDAPAPVPQPAYVSYQTPVTPTVPVPAAPVVVVPARVSGAYANGYTWHLSVINAGQPRSNRSTGDALVTLTSTPRAPDGWVVPQLQKARWLVNRGDEGGNQEIIFGMIDGIPVTGDFNGDGVTDVGVFSRGQWFIDVNGNGVWDKDDLWAKLGYQDDLPVTGDWDGDGKTDIGIFGRAWPGDPRAIAEEPGLPDPDNANQGARKNRPPQPEIAPRGSRVMQRTALGKTRADLIDHVFHYGSPGDRPIAGDWNGSGADTIGVFRDGLWHLDMDGDGKFRPDHDESFTMGTKGDLPVVGDFNGDGTDEVGIYRRGVWHIDMNGDHVLDERDLKIVSGDSDDIPAVGDWNGDGRDDPGLFTNAGDE